MDAIPLRVQDARVEFARLFGMSAYPYSSVFLDDPAALNGESTAKVDEFYRRVGFEPNPIWPLGAADALGAELEFVAWLLDKGDEKNAHLFLRKFLLTWAPACCHAIERNARLEFYSRLASVTRELLFEAADDLQGFTGEQDTEGFGEGEGERDLSWLVDYLTTPARSGFFVSKQELGRVADGLQIPISFGDRALALASLLRGAGAQERIVEALGALRQITEEWSNTYEGWISDHPLSAPLWGRWFARTESTHRMLIDMQAAASEASAEKV